MEDDDLKWMGQYKKSLRKERQERFEDNWLEKLRKVTNVTERDNGSYTFDSKFGIIDFYPKSNKVLIRAVNQWKNGGLKFIIANIIKD